MRSSGTLCDQRVDDAHAFESREIAVGGPKFANPVKAADGEDAGIVSGRTGDASGLERMFQFGPVSRRLTEQVQRRRFHPRFNLLDSLLKRSWRAINPRAGHNPE